MLYANSSFVFARWKNIFSSHVFQVLVFLQGGLHLENAALILSYVYVENRASGKLHKRKITIIQITKLCKKERSKK